MTKTLEKAYARLKVGYKLVLDGEEDLFVEDTISLGVWFSRNGKNRFLFKNSLFEILKKGAKVKKVGKNERPD